MTDGLDDFRKRWGIGAQPAPAAPATPEAPSYLSPEARSRYSELASIQLPEQPPPQFSPNTDMSVVLSTRGPRRWDPPPEPEKPPAATDFMSPMARFGMSTLATAARSPATAALAVEMLEDEDEIPYLARRVAEEPGFAESYGINVERLVEGSPAPVVGPRFQPMAREDAVQLAAERIAEKRSKARLQQMATAAEQDPSFAASLGRGVGGGLTTLPATVIAAQALPAVSPIIQYGLASGMVEGLMPAAAEAVGGPKAQGTVHERFEQGMLMGMLGGAGSAAGRAIAQRVIPGTGALAGHARGALEGAATGLGFGLPLGGQQGLADALLGAATGGLVRVPPKGLADLPEPTTRTAERPTAEAFIQGPPRGPEAFQAGEVPLDRPEQPLPAMRPAGTRPPVVEDPYREDIKRQINVGKEPESTRYRTQRLLEHLQDQISTLGAAGPQSGRGVSMGHGRVKAEGLFYPHSEEVKLRKRGDQPTFAHELTHALQKAVLGTKATGGFWKSIDNDHPFLVAHERELVPLSYDDDPNLSRVEGLAEWGKVFLSRPDKARELAPKTYDDFTRAIGARDAGLPRRERILPTIRRIQESFEAQRLGDPTVANTWYPDEVYDFTSWRDKNKRKDYVRRFTIAVQNAHLPVEEVVKTWKAQHPGVAVSADLDPSAWITAGRSSGHRIGEAFIWEAPVDPKTGGPRKDRKSLSAILGQMSWDDHKQFDAYWQDRQLLSIAERVGSTTDARVQKRMQSLLDNELRARGVTLDQLRGMVAERDRMNPRFRGMLDDVQGYIHDLQDYSVGMGHLDQGLVDSLRERYPVYAPLKRRLTGQQQRAAAAGKSFVDVRSGIKTRKGSSELSVVSPLTSLVEMTYIFPRLAERAKVGNALIDMVRTLEGGSKYATKLEKPPKPTQLKMDELMGQLEALGFDKDAMNPGDNLTIWRPDYMFGLFDDGIVKVKNGRSGEVEFWKVHDPYLLESLKSYDSTVAEQWGKIGKVIATLASIKRTMINLSGGFIAGQLVRDPVARAVNVGRLSTMSPHRLVPALRDVLFGQAGKSKWYQEYVRSGAAMGSLHNLDLKKIHHSLQDIVTGKRRLGAGSKAVRLVRGISEASRVVEESVEGPGREEHFKYRMQNPLPEDAGNPLAMRLRAAMEAREAGVDFSRRGGGPEGMGRFMRTWSLLTPYMNPAIQGAAKTASNIRHHPGRYAMATAAVVLAKATTYLWNREDETRRNLYDKLPDHEKDGRVVHIQASKEEYDALLSEHEKSLYEGMVRDGTVEKHGEDYARLEAKLQAEARMARWLRDRTWGIPLPQDLGVLATVVERLVLKPMLEDPDIGEEARKTLKHAWDTQAPPMIPEPARLLAEGYFGVDTFRDRPVVGEWQKRIPEEMQYDDSTSELAKWAGEKLGLSPKKIDHILSAGIGRSATQSLDVLLSDDKRAEAMEDPSRRLPWLRDFVGRFGVENPSRSMRPLERFYEVYKDRSEVRLGYSDLKNKKRDLAAAEAYGKEHTREIQEYALASEVATNLSAMRSRIVDIRRGNKPYEGLDQARKRELQDAEVLRMIHLAEQFLGMVEGPEEEK